MMFRLRLWLGHIKEAVIIWIAWHLPHKVVHWAAIRLMAHATQGIHRHQIVPGLTIMDALGRWDKPNTEDQGAGP